MCSKYNDLKIVKIQVSTRKEKIKYFYKTIMLKISVLIYEIIFYTSMDIIRACQILLNN